MDNGLLVCLSCLTIQLGFASMSNAVLVTELIAGLPKYSSSLYTAGVSRYPTTPGQHVVVLHDSYLFGMGCDEFCDIMNFVCHVAHEVKSLTQVKRCGLSYDGHQCLHIIPMHGLDDDWKPVRAPLTELEEAFPGFLWSKSGPPMDVARLSQIQTTLAAKSGWTTPDHTFIGDASDDNLFARLIRGEIAQWRVWEDGQHLAFLTPFPSTPGYTVLIPRRHLPSDVLGLAIEDFESLMRATLKVVNVLQVGLGVSRVGMFFEGFEIDYAHIKLVPIIGSEAIEGPSEEYHEIYPGYLTTRLGPEKTEISQAMLR